VSLAGRILVALAILWGPVLVLASISLLAYWMEPDDVEDQDWAVTQAALGRVNRWPPTDEEALPVDRRPGQSVPTMRLVGNARPSKPTRDRLPSMPLSHDRAAHG
jgi:hypothetical protein